MGGHHLSDNIIGAVMLFIVLYFIVILVSIVLAMLLGTNAVDAVSGVVASVGSVGPGIGNIGSLENYSSQLVSAKIIYTIDMFLGRLEIYPVLVVLSMIFRREK